MQVVLSSHRFRGRPAVSFCPLIAAHHEVPHRPLVLHPISDALKQVVIPTENQLSDRNKFRGFWPKVHGSDFSALAEVRSHHHIQPLPPPRRFGTSVILYAFVIA